MTTHSLTPGLLRRFRVLSPFIAIPFLFSVTNCASTISSSAPRLAEPIVVDGSSAEWKELPRVFLSESVQILSVAHDSENVYVMFRFGDLWLAERIAAHGVTLWVDAEKTESKRFGIRYSGSLEVIAGIHESGGGERPFSSDPKPGNLVILRNGEREVRPGQQPGGAKAASGIRDGGYCYEFAVPISSIPGFAAARTELPKTIFLGIEIGGMAALAENRNGDRAGGGEWGAGSGERHGGGMAGGRRGHGRRRESRSPDVATPPVWLTVQLEP